VNEKRNETLSNKTILLMAIVTGVIVANLNFIQPIENLIATDFGLSKAVVGALAMVTQLGYAFGPCSSCRWAIFSTVTT